MASYALPLFGNVDTENLEEYYDVVVDFNGQEIQVDLNFESNTCDTKRLDIVKHFIENIVAFDKKNKGYIEQDYADEECDTVRTYVEHHLENIDKDDLSELIAFNNERKSPDIQLVNALRLVRLGLYPDSAENFATFDYSIDPEMTDHLVVIFTFSTGDMNYMTIES